MMQDQSLEGKVEATTLMQEVGQQKGPLEEDSRPKLFTNPQTRGAVVQWAVDEFRLTGEIEIEQVDYENNQHKTADYLENVHMFGRVPALVDGDLKLFESGAILLYLADRFGLTSNPKERAQLATWVIFANSTFTIAVFVENENQAKHLPECLRGLDKALSGKSFLVDGKFTIADVAVVSVLMWGKFCYQDKLDLSPYPNVLSYFQAVKKRDLYVKYFSKFT